ncbi:(2Fe-2S)-binding protein [Rubrivivax gelatinosus]|uniref:Bacterioferritin-associated ferredoxin n=1 Tax=Rubrivivax gelatinosus (strain NBRC 100245 / IL144) TaxID=983917 RepID=I0HM56_RUBGI|nr:(2Fe-2S)-binding protein [Rubrivivax gelatinosus]MBG6080700.1 bacterioferritin-associated ferredoxin [Rubrivivax gelatinosus]BAL94093.1 bacterioferritin-associated ferredoxin protein Bfd [Rubrivivax gelatinosus IL144]
MIVCLCHRVSDRDIAAAVESGTRCFDVLQDDLRVASSCGCCHDCAREVFDTALARHAGATSSGAAQAA